MSLILFECLMRIVLFFIMSVLLGWFVLSKLGESNAPVGTQQAKEIESGITPADQKDFDLQLLREAAKKYTDPNNIADIPNNVIIEDFINIAFSNHDWASDYPWYDRKKRELYQQASLGSRIPGMFTLTKQGK